MSILDALEALVSRGYWSNGVVEYWKAGKPMSSAGNECRKLSGFQYILSKI